MGCEMHDCLDAILTQHAAEQIAVRQIARDERPPLYRPAMTIDEIIQRHRDIACLC